MENQENRRSFHQSTRRRRGTFSYGDRQSTEERLEEIERRQSVHMTALSQQAFGLSASQSARTEAVLQRLGLRSQDGPLPSPPTCPSAVIRRSSGSSSSSDGDWSRTPDSLRADSQTPEVLRRLGRWTPSPTVPPQPLPRRKASRLPTLKTKGEVKVVAGYRLLTASNQMRALLETSQRLQHSCPHCGQPAGAQAPVPQAPAFHTGIPCPPPRAPVHQVPVAQAPVPRAPVVQAHVPVFEVPVVPTPPKGGTRAPRTRRPHPGLRLRPSFQSDKLTLNKEEALQALLENKAESQPYDDPSRRLAECFDWLERDDWQEKMSALDTLQTLIVQHQDTVLTKLRKVCLVLIEEVNNLRSSVACAAVDTITMLYLHLQQIMDPEVETTARALLLRLAQGRDTFIKEKVSVALDALVQNCSYRRVVTALLNSGHNHCFIGVRASTAEHLGQLVDSIGTDDLFATGRLFSEQLVVAVSQMAVDAAPEVRHKGLRILKEFTQHQDFIQIWNQNVPLKDQGPLNNILKNLK